jgi:hypothetical protein
MINSHSLDDYSAEHPVLMVIDADGTTLSTASAGRFSRVASTPYRSGGVASTSPRSNTTTRAWEARGRLAVASVSPNDSRGLIGCGLEWLVGLGVGTAEARMTPEERFAELVDELVELPGVTPPGAGRGFGSSALRIRGRIFAMLAHDRLVVKLPAARVDELVAAGDGVRFDGNKGVPMKEWFSVDPDGQLSWRQLAHEALVFVAPK